MAEAVGGTERNEMMKVFWPGKPTIACPKHLRQLVGLSAVLGFRLDWIPTEGECDNCNSEAERDRKIAAFEESQR